MTEKLSVVQVVQEGYGTTPPQTEVLRTKLDGGLARYRADIIGGSTLVNVTWIVDGHGYDYLWAFFRNRIARGATPFLIDLKVETSALTEYTAYYIPGSLALRSVQGDIYTVVAQLEVEALDADDGFDSSIVDVYQASGGDPETYLNLFEKIINTLP